MQDFGFVLYIKIIFLVETKLLKRVGGGTDDRVCARKTWTEFFKHGLRGKFQNNLVFCVNTLF